MRTPFLLALTITQSCSSFIPFYPPPPLPIGIYGQSLASSPKTNPSCLTFRDVCKWITLVNFSAAFGCVYWRTYSRKAEILGPSLLILLLRLASNIHITLKMCENSQFQAQPCCAHPLRLMFSAANIVTLILRFLKKHVLKSSNLVNVYFRGCNVSCNLVLHLFSSLVCP